MIGFFLPGDSLLFTVGVVAGAGQLDMFAINALLIVAAIVGDGVGYLFQKNSFTSLRLCHDHTSLTFSNRSEKVKDSC